MLNAAELKTFAANVLAGIKRLQGNPNCEGMFFGDDRFFICHAYGLFGGMLSREDFVAALVEANRTRLLSLSRADMVELMDPVDVKQSEVLHLGSSFHFIAL